ncbi:MAG: DUF4367 domain-containing protein [Peptococcaceae bacterium]|nr:DUF4367 domain-containing protein [Peptococcaceae bacterium]
MKQYSEAELDKIIRETVREMVDSITPPPLEESWARFEKKLREQQKNSPAEKRKIPLSLKLAAAAGFIVILAGALSISFPVKARAIGDKILYTVESLLSGTQMNIKTTYRHNEPDQPPPPPETGFREVYIGEEQVVSLEEAKTVSPFPVAVPRYVPAGYGLDQVKYHKLVEPIARVTLSYTGPNLNYFEIEETNVPEGYTQGYGYDTEDAVVEDVKVGNNIAKLIVFKNDEIRLTWINQDVLYTMEGRIAKEEALKVARSLQ